MDIPNLFKKALTIRKVEEILLQLFYEKKIRGTIHSSIGQEVAAVAVCEALRCNDFVFSNHRCHGHYLALTEDIEGLIAEVAGKKQGACGGIGGSMNLHGANFLSNGVIGGMIGIAAGVGMSYKILGSDAISVCFIGDGAMGQGIVYETLNIASLLDIPVLFVCENNMYSYDTPQHKNCAGDIIQRAKAFSIQTFSSNVWNIENLIETARDSVNYVRSGKPAFFLIDSYRLLSHSTHCNDFRDPEEIKKYEAKDFLNIYRETHPAFSSKIEAKICSEISSIVEKVMIQDSTSIHEYYTESSNSFERKWTPLIPLQTRQVKLINEFFHEAMAAHDNVIVMGEDILSPFGGAFKVTSGLSDVFPDRVFSMPISEQAMTGICIGLAIGGFRPFLEIMFGDFLTLCMDQLLNHASKMYYMYNKAIRCPVVIRTPVGVGGGMGATHSQSLEKFIIGVDGVKTIALNNLINPKDIYNTILTSENDPVIVFENKQDYGKRIASKLIKKFIFEKSNHKYPIVRIRPNNGKPNITVLTYGGMVDVVVDSIIPLFIECEIIPEIFVLSCLSDIDYVDINQSVRSTQRLFVVEEGSMVSGIGSEVISCIREQLDCNFLARRIASLPLPLPAVKSLEDDIVPNVSMILDKIKESINEHTTTSRSIAGISQ